MTDFFFNLISFLFGCRHRRITRPMTPARQGADGKWVQVGDCYVCCLTCGKEMFVDLTTWKLTRNERRVEVGERIREAGI
jgi:hypothetical protein